MVSNNITHIILAGYLKLISPKLIEIYKDKILNIHPSLLPKFGGKGYYGNFVHESVINSKEKYGTEMKKNIAFLFLPSRIQRAACQSYSSSK